MAPNPVTGVVVQGNGLRQVVDRNAFLDGLIDFFGDSGHFLTRSSIHDTHALGTQAQCGTGGIHGSIATTDDDNILAVYAYAFTMYMIEKIDALNHGLGAIQTQSQISLLLQAGGHQHSVVFSRQVEQSLSINLVVSLYGYT